MVRRFALGGLLALALQGCTVVHIDSPDGRATVIRRFGVVRIEPSQTTSIVRVTSVGVHSAFGVVSVGFGRTEAATVVPGTCQVILWAASPATITNLKELMGGDNDLCALGNTAARSVPTTTKGDLP